MEGGAPSLNQEPHAPSATFIEMDPATTSNKINSTSNKYPEKEEIHLGTIGVHFILFHCKILFQDIVRTITVDNLVYKWHLHIFIG